MMVANIGRIPNPMNGRIGLAGGRSLAERYEAAKAMALREIKPTDSEYAGLHVMMVSEASIDTFYDLVRQSKERHTPKRSPGLTEAWNELLDMQRTINALIDKVESAQQHWLWRARNSWKHQLLKSVRADMTAKVEREDLDWEESLYPDVFTTRQAIKQKRIKLEQVQELVDLTVNGEAFDEMPVELQSEHLCHALFDENTALKKRVSALEAALLKPKSSNRKEA